jgi:hypothetical protein
MLNAFQPDQTRLNPAPVKHSQERVCSFACVLKITEQHCVILRAFANMQTPRAAAEPAELGLTQLASIHWIVPSSVQTRPDPSTLGITIPYAHETTA